MKTTFGSISFSLFLTFGIQITQAQEKNSIQNEGSIKISESSVYLRPGGYIKADFIHDLNPINSPDFFDVSKIPTDGSEGQRSHMNAKESRIFLDGRLVKDNSEIKGYIEGDFYGANGTFRLRHAYIEINDKWFAGQYWSNFMDEDIIPKTLDFEKPAAYAFARNVMFRRKFNLNDKSYFALAIEEPKTTALAPIQSGVFENPYPDLTARYRISGDKGHFQLSGFAGVVRYRFDSTALGTEDVNVFGGNISFKYNVSKHDYIIFQALAGPGSGRYRGGLSAATDSSNKLVAINDLGVTVGFHHQWSSKFTSLIVYNHGIIENSEGQPGNSANVLNYFAVNILYHFEKNALFGIEYLRGERIDKDKNSGEANRIQMSLKYQFN